MAVKVIGIVGSYRKGKTIDSAVSAILEGAKGKGAETKKIYLLDKHIEFCTNCRSCTQEKAEGRRGKCVHNDDMDNILTEIDDADAVVLGSPVRAAPAAMLMLETLALVLIPSDACGNAGMLTLRCPSSTASRSSPIVSFTSRIGR